MVQQRGYIYKDTFKSVMDQEVAERGNIFIICTGYIYIMLVLNGTAKRLYI